MQVFGGYHAIMRFLCRVQILALVPIFWVYPALAQEFGNFNTVDPLVTLTNAGAGTSDSPDQLNKYGRGAIVGINIAAKTGTISVVVSIQGKDAVSGQYYLLCQSAALTAAGFTPLVIYPGVPETTNALCSRPLPALWRVRVVSGAGVTPSVTMKVGASVIQ